MTINGKGGAVREGDGFLQTVDWIGASNVDIPQHGDAATCQNMQRRADVVGEGDVAAGANDGVVGTEQIAGTAVELLNAEVAAAPVVGIAADGGGGAQHQIAAGEEAAVGMVEGKNIEALVALEEQLVACSGNEGGVNLVADAQRIQRSQGEVAARLQLTGEIEGARIQGEVLADGEVGSTGEGASMGGAVLQTDGDIHLQERRGLWIGGAEAQAVAEVEAVGGAGEEGAANVELGVGAEEDAIGIEQEEVGATGNAQRSQNVGAAVAGDAAEDVGNAAGVGEVEPLAGVDVELQEAVEQVDPACRATVDAIGAIGGQAVNEGVGSNAGAFGAQGVVGDDLTQGGRGKRSQR